MTQELVSDLSVILPSVLLTLMLILFVQTDVYIGKDHRKVLLIVSTLILSLIAQNYTDLLLQGRYVNILLRTAVTAFGYILRPVILVLFCHVVNPGGRFMPAWALTAINGAVYLTAFFSPLTFWISESNHYHGGPLKYTCHVISAILLIYLLFRSGRKYQTTGRRNNWILVLPVLLIIGSVVMDESVTLAEQTISFLTIAIIICSIFYYVWLHLQFVREHEEDLEAQQRIKIMISQIQPHFLYNTLSTIQAMCETDPKGAKETVEKFGMYLRQNIDSLNETALIPVQKELEHARIYTDIEKVGYDNIEVEYNIRDTNFSVPALTIQPLVENAIRHGICIREKGLVTVVTQRNDSFHEIVVKDNGKGFDAKLAEDSSGTHIGLKNVRERIEKICGGTMHIDSRMDEGTTITIRIPQGRTGVIDQKNSPKRYKQKKETAG